MEVESWLRQMQDYLIHVWGLDLSFASKVALLILYFYHYNLSPVITSGWRSPEKQKELLRRYEAGDPSIVAKPALKSLHLNTKMGKPASLAIDIATNDRPFAARIANYLGIRAGFYFKKPDPVHFDVGL